MSVHQELAAVRSRDSASIAGTPPSPVKLWAGIGAIILSVFAWTLFQWVTSPYFKPAPVGNDPISPTTLMLVHITDISAVPSRSVFSTGSSSSLGANRPN